MWMDSYFFRCVCVCSCYHCKTTLYETIGRVATFAVYVAAIANDVAAADGLIVCGGERSEKAKCAGASKPIIYNGTNADDQLDPTRLGASQPVDEQSVREENGVQRS